MTSIFKIQYSEYFTIIVTLSSSQVDSLCWPPLEMFWLDWEGLQLQLRELLYWMEFPQLLRGSCPSLLQGQREYLVRNKLITNYFL